MSAERTWPLEPVEDFIRRHWPEAFEQPSSGIEYDSPMPDARVHILIGWSRGRWTRRKWKRGELTDVEAEEIGLELAGDPSRIWHDWWSTVLEEEAS